MNNPRGKKTKSEIAQLIGAVSMLLGLVVMLIGLAVAGDKEDLKSLATMLVGIGIFAGSAVAVCVASVYVRRDKKRQTEKIKAALPENAVLLNGGASAYFTDEGLRVIRDNTFTDFEPALPYAEIAVYCRRIRKSFRAKGKETIFLVLPLPQGDFLAEKGENAHVVGEEILPLAQRFGVKVIDTRHAPVKKATLKAKFVHRYPRQRKTAALWTVISIAAFAAVLGVGVLISLNTQYNVSGIMGGVAAGVVTPCVLTAARHWKRNVLRVYEEGISLSMFGSKTFLFWEEIIAIEAGEVIFFDCGVVGAGYPALETAVKYLRENYPEKFKEDV